MTFPKQLPHPVHPEANYEQIMKVVVLQQQKQQMMSRLLWCQSAIQDQTKEVLNMLEGNVAIAEENRQLRECILAEVGGELLNASCDLAHEAASAIYNHDHHNVDELWKSELQAVTQAMELDFHAGIDSMLHGPLMFRNSVPVDSVALPGRLKANSCCKQQVVHRDLKQSMPALAVLSHLEVIESYVPPSSSGRAQVDNSQQVQPTFTVSSSVNNSKAGDQMVWERPLCDRVLSESETTTCLEPATEDDLVRCKASSVDASLQEPLHMLEPTEILEAVANAVPEHQLQPSHNGKPARPLPHGVTTIVVRNIPARLSREALLEVWRPNGTYNLIYLPFDFQRQRSSGMAIINMISHQAAVEFAARWHGQKLVDCGHVKRLDVGAASIQGFFENLKHLKKHKISKLRNESFLPLVFKGTNQLDIKALLAHKDFFTLGEHQLDAFDRAGSSCLFS